MMAILILLLVGNDYGADPYSGRNDAFDGLCMLGDGKGNFKPLTIAQSGFYVPHDGKALTKVHSMQKAKIYMLLRKTRIV